MRTCLDEFRLHTKLDVDCNDAQIAVKHKPFNDMTSNQLIVLSELKKPGHSHILGEAIIKAKGLQSEFNISDGQMPAFVVDCVTVHLGMLVMPHLEPKGFLHAQTNPSQADDKEATISQALRLASLYEEHGLRRSRVCIKIPSTLAGLQACAVLEKEHNLRTLATTCFCLEQGLAAADAGCLYVAPYVNPLVVHLVPSEHVVYKDPLKEMRGVQVSREVQAAYKKTGASTQVLAASLVTADEIMSLCGISHVTLSPAALEVLASTSFDQHYQELRDRALKPAQAGSESYSEEGLKKALAEEPVAGLQKDALQRFEKAEKELVEIATAALE